MLQLASTCEAMGIPKDTVKTLRRWDRVHMIKELAGVAVGVCRLSGGLGGPVTRNGSSLFFWLMWVPRSYRVL